jgi:pimeloyl-ACP methyl ester carboxylesterase
MHSLAGVAYEERGAGEVVCLVHAGVFGAWFAPLFEQPALDGFRVIRPIRPGYGRSLAPSGPPSIAAHARRCGALLRGLGVTRAHWVGHSSSCCIGLQLALDDPGLVASLTLFEPAKPSGKQREAAASTYVGPALAAAAQGDVARAFDVFLRGVGGDGYREVLRARLGDDGLAEAERESAYFFADELPALAAWTFGPAEAARVAAPALLLRGAGSRPWFRENVAILAELLPDARTETLPELQHLAPLTHPGELASTIREFVSDRGRRAMGRPATRTPLPGAASSVEPAARRHGR